MDCHFEERENALCDSSFVGMTIIALFKLRYAKSPDFATNKHIHKLTKNQLAPVAAASCCGGFRHKRYSE